MLLTEGYAKTRWCPETRVVTVVTPTLVAAGNTANIDNRGEGLYPDTRCKGVGCMMWRWSNAWDGNHRLGYCGKAGPAI